MSCLNNIINRNAEIVIKNEDPGFSIIIGCNYYDGPETGLAIYPSGWGVRFSSLGDSDSRTERAFEMLALDQNWDEILVENIGKDWSRFRGKILLCNKDSTGLLKAYKMSFEARVTGRFVATGACNFSRLTIMSADQNILDKIKNVNGSPADYAFIASMIQHL